MIVVVEPGRILDAFVAPRTPHEFAVVTDERIEKGDLDAIGMPGVAADPGFVGSDPVPAIEYAILIAVSRSVRTIWNHRCGAADIAVGIAAGTHAVCGPIAIGRGVSEDQPIAMAVDV